MKRALILLLLAGSTAGAAEYPRPVEADFVLKDFKFATGETLPELRIHYRTVGEPQRNAAGEVTNAVLVLHGTTGQGGNFVEGPGGEMFAGELFGKGQPLDAEKFFIVLPDGIGHGKSSRASDGLHARFPRYGYRDMIAAQHRLLTDGLGVKHARVVMGTSMGGMHSWLWGQTYPDFMDALVPLASLPTQISGRNRMWRRMVSDAIRTDPGWEGGEYNTQPHGLRFAAGMVLLMSSSPLVRQKQAPTMKAADALYDRSLAQMVARMDANDVLYAVEASHDYDPGPGLEKIKAPLLAINFADDLINPPELGILEREIKRVPNGKAIVFPISEETVGHGTHTKAAVWKRQFEEFLKSNSGK
jgi:homoserine O-acetyltransferase